VRATTAFNKMLSIPGALVIGVQFGPVGIVVSRRRRTRRLRCPCGWSTRAIYDRSTRRWRNGSPPRVRDGSSIGARSAERDHPGACGDGRVGRRGQCLLVGSRRDPAAVLGQHPADRLMVGGAGRRLQNRQVPQSSVETGDTPPRPPPRGGIRRRACRCPSRPDQTPLDETEPVRSVRNRGRSGESLFLQSLH
jgi:hypothetical protein